MDRNSTIPCEESPKLKPRFALPVEGGPRGELGKARPGTLKVHHANGLPIRLRLHGENLALSHGLPVDPKEARARTRASLVDLDP